MGKFHLDRVSGHNQMGRGLYRVLANTALTDGGSVIEIGEVAALDSKAVPPNNLYWAKDWVPSQDAVTFKYEGTRPVHVRVTVTGLVTSSYAQNAGHIALVIVGSEGGVYTGSPKVYAAGSLGAQNTLHIGFTTIGYGEVIPGESLSLYISKNFTEGVVLEESMICIEYLL